MASRESRARTRERLLGAATKVFARDGIDATSIDQIVTEAGLTKGALYSNFASKEDLVFAVIEQVSTMVDPSALFDPNLNFDEQLRELGRSAARTLRGSSRQQVLLDRAVQTYILRHPGALHRHRKELRELADVGGAMLEEIAATQNRALPVPGRQFVHVLMALTRGMIEAALQDPQLATEEHFAEAFALLASTTRAGDRL